MENKQLPQEILQIFAGIGRARLFWECNQMMHGEPLLLSFLYDNHDATPKELAKVMQVSPARITVILGSLECKHMVRRVLDGMDRRRMHVQLTDDGAAAVERMRQEALDRALTLCERLGEADTQTLIHIVNRLLKQDELLQTAQSDDARKEATDAES